VPWWSIATWSSPARTSTPAGWNRVSRRKAGEAVRDAGLTMSAFRPPSPTTADVVDVIVGAVGVALSKSTGFPHDGGSQGAPVEGSEQAS
jgi:hypothetical protein